MKSGETKLFLGILVAAVAMAAVAIYPAITAMRTERPGKVVIRDPVKAKVTRADLFPAGSHYRGDKDAPYLLVEFADYECPLCATSVGEVKKILEAHKGKFCFVFHGIQITGSHVNALLMAQTAEAAGFQGKFWEMHELLMERQGRFRGLTATDAVDEVMKFGKELRLDMLKFGADLRGKQATRAQERTSKLGTSAHIDSTPTFFVVPPKGPTLKFGGLRELINWAADPKNIP